jgi:hypothetical protein
MQSFFPQKLESLMSYHLRTMQETRKKRGEVEVLKSVLLNVHEYDKIPIKKNLAITVILTVNKN